MIDLISQAAVLVTGVVAIYLVNRVDHWQRWGCIVGMAGQPAWFYQFAAHEQYLMLVVAVLYTYSWAQGIYNHWLRT